MMMVNGDNISDDDGNYYIHNQIKYKLLEKNINR